MKHRIQGHFTDELEDIKHLGIKLTKIYKMSKKMIKNELR